MDAPLVAIGLCTDVQGGAKPDATSKDDPTRVLRYSEAASLLGEAVDYFRATGSLSLVLHCGDIIDGRDDEETDLEDLAAVLAHFRRLVDADTAVCHVIGNHCLKHIPRVKLHQELGLGADGYYAKPLCPGWTLLVLDTTELSVHAGWPEGSPEHAAAQAYLSAHAGEPRMQRWNGGAGAAQLAWLKSQLVEASAESRRVIVASHHGLVRGACRETHRAWNGDEVCAVLRQSGVVALCLAGHDHIGGFAHVGGMTHVTLEAILESPAGSNAFGVLRIYADRIEIDGCGTALTSRTLPLPPLSAGGGHAHAGGGHADDRDEDYEDDAGAGEPSSRPLYRIPSASELSQQEKQRQFMQSLAGGAPASQREPPSARRDSREAELEVAAATGAAAAGPAAGPAAGAAVGAATGAATGAAAGTAADETGAPPSEPATEVSWLLTEEVAPALSRVCGSLRRCAQSLAEGAVPTARSAQLRGGEADDGMLVAAVVGATALHAMRMQIEFPKWNESRPYVGMLMGGQRASVTLPGLLHVQNRVAQAIGACAHGATQLSGARSTVTRVLSLVSDAARTLSLSGHPQAPSSLAPTLTSMMQPEVPPGVIIDVNVASSPPRLIFSSYLLRPSDGVVLEARHVSVFPEELNERLELLTETTRELRGLLAKLEALDGAW